MRLIPQALSSVETNGKWKNLWVDVLQTLEEGYSEDLLLNGHRN